MPPFRTAVLVDHQHSPLEIGQLAAGPFIIVEHSSTEGRHIYDSDNKGWKAVSNALKGRLFPDDDQYTLALSLLSTRSTENVCHITLLDLADAADFFAVHSGDYRDGDFYSGRWTT